MSEEVKLGLSNLKRKKTERPTPVIPVDMNDESFIPKNKILRQYNRRLKSIDIPKTLRVPIDTHLAISTIATLEDKKIYEVVNEMVESYLSEMPDNQKDIVRSNVRAAQINRKT